MQNIFNHNKSVNPLERPLKEIIDLNIKTIQGFTFLNPTELLSSRKPEELISKNLDAIIKNSHNALNYAQNVFSIMEKFWLNVSDIAKVESKELKMPSLQDFANSTLRKVGAKTVSRKKVAAKKTVSASAIKPSIAKKAASTTTKAKALTKKKTVLAAAKKAASTLVKAKPVAKKKVLSAKAKKPLLAKTLSTVVKAKPVAKKKAVSAKAKKPLIAKKAASTATKLTTPKKVLSTAAKKTKVSKPKTKVLKAKPVIKNNTFKQPLLSNQAKIPAINKTPEIKKPGSSFVKPASQFGSTKPVIPTSSGFHNIDNQ